MVPAESQIITNMIMMKLIIVHLCTYKHICVFAL